MARTEIHPISSTLNIAIDYIIDPEKTDGQKLCSTYECTLQCAAMDFEDVHMQGTGRTTVLAQHMIQSFKPGEVSPDEAHKIGRELCDKYLKGRYQYVIATHVDKDHIHNHIIFNNINLENHKSFEYLENRNKNSSERLRLLSDEICEDHNLSVIQNPERGTSKSYYEWQQDKLGNSWKSKLRNAIDNAVKESDNFDEFLMKMKEQGYEYKQGKYLSFRASGQERFTRCKRSTLGWYYEQPQIVKRIARYNAFKNQKTRQTNIIDKTSDRIKSSKGLERWATIHNMQVASQMINILTEKGFSSPDEIDDKLMQLHEDKLRLADRLNDLQDAINNASELVKLLETYRKFKPVYSQYKDVRNKEKFRKEHSSEIAKYESAVRQLKEQFPDNKIPQLESERNKIDLLISERNELNSRYKEVKAGIEETELAKQSVEEYLSGQNRDEISH